MRQKQFLLAFLAMLLCFAAPSFAQVAKIGDTEYATLKEAMTEANKAAGNYTITLLQNSAEVFTFAQKSGVNITIDGDQMTFSGKITLNAGGGNLTFTDAKIAPANSQTIYLNASTAPNITFDGCTLQGANKSGTIIYAYASATNNALTVKNCTADNLQYIVSCRQTGSSSVLVENVTATNMIYLARTQKCPSVTIKNTTCDAVIGVDIKNDAAGGKLTLENVNINTVPYNGSLYTPVSGSGAGKTWTVEVNGVNKFSKNGEKTKDNDWFSGNEGYELVVAKNSINPQPAGYVAYRADVTDNANREGIAILLKEVYAENSLVVKVYNDETLMFTCTRRDIDDEGKDMFPVKNANTTANIVLWGKESGSWINEIHVQPTKNNVPNKIDVYADDIKVNTYTHESGTILGTNLEKYLALECVKDYVAMIGEQGYATLAEAMAAANENGNSTITLLADNAESFEFAQKNGVNITIDGDGKTFTGKITLNAGAGNLTFTDMTLTPSNADAKSIILNASTAPNVTIDGCTLKNTGTKGAIVWGLASATSNKVVIKNSTASHLQYLVGTNQSGAEDVTIENVTATDMAYLIRPMKATKVTVKDVTYSGLTFVQVKNSNSSTLALENVTVTTTQAGMPPITMMAPDSGVPTTKYTITLKGENIANGAEMTPADEATWFATAKDGLSYEIVNLNAVVKIGDMGYSTFDEAYAAAREGDVIELLETIVLEPEEDKTYENVSVNAAFDDVAFRIQGAKKVTFKNAKVTSNDYCFIVGEKEGENKPTLEIISGEYKGETTIVSVTRGTASILGGTFAAEPWEGSYTYTLNCYDATYKTGDAKIEVKGGSFKNFDPANNAAEGVGTNFVADNYCSVKEGDDYKVVEAAAKVGNKGYATFSEAYAAAQAGHTITLLRDINSSDIIVLNKAISLDGNGKTLTSTAARAINVDNANGATIKNLTIEASGERAINVINKATNVTIEKVTATAANYTVNLAASAANAVVAIKDSNLTGLNVVNVAAANAQVTVDGTTLVCNDQTSTESYAAIAVNKESKNATVVVTNSTFDIKGDSAKVSNGAEGATITIDGVEYNEKIVAVIEYEGTDNYYSFDTLAKAVAKAQAGETVKLIADATGAGVVINKSITIDFNGKTYSFNEGVGSTGTETLGLQILKGNNVTLKNGTLTSEGENIKMLVQNYANLTVDNMKLVDATDAIQYVLSNNSGNVVVKNASKITANGAIAFDACKYANYALPTVTIEDGVVVTGDVEVSATLNFAGTLNGNIIINGAEGVVNSTVEGLNVTTNIDGRKVAYVDGKYTVVEKNYIAQVGEAKYETLAEAVAAAQAGATVTLLANVEEDVTLSKNVTIDGAQKNYTGTMTVNNVTATIQNVAFVKGQVYKHKSTGSAAQITIKNCTFDGQDLNAYAVNVGNGKSIALENVTAKNYGYGLLQVPSSFSSISVKDVEVSNMYYGFKVDYAGAVSMENVKVADDVTIGIYDSNYGDKTYTITNCEISTISIWERTAAKTTTFKFEGLNKVNTLTTSQYAKIDAEAKSSNNYYGELAAVVEAATAGATVELLADVTLVGGNEKDAEAGLVIDKAMTLDGNNHTIDCGTFVKGIRIYGPDNLSDMKINNVTIVNSNENGRCVDTRKGYLRLKFSKANLIATNGNSQPLTVGGSEKLHQIDLSECTIDAGNSGYGIISFVPTNQAIKVMSSTVTGYAGIYLKGDGTKVTITTNSNVIGKNVHSGATNAFGAVVFEGNNNVVNINATSPMLKAIAEGDQAQAAILVKSGEGNKVVFETNKKAEILAEGENAYWAMVSAEATGTTITKDGVAVALQAECDGFQFLTLEDALRYSKDNSTVKLLADVNYNTTENLVTDCDGYASIINVEGKTLTFDLNGKTMTVNAYAADLAEAKNEMLMAVFSTDEGGKLTLKDSSEAKTGTVEVVANDAKVYSLITNYEGGCFVTIEGGNYVADKVYDSLIYSGASDCVTINNGNYRLDNVGEGSNGKPWIFNALGQNERNIDVNGGTFNADINHQHWCFEVDVPNDCALRYNGDEAGTWTVVDAEAYVEEPKGKYTHEVGYPTLSEAIARALELNNTSVVMVKNVEVVDMITVANGKVLTLDLNGKTITATDNTSKNYSAIDNRGDLTITGEGKMTVEAKVNSGWNRYSAVIANNPGGKLIIESGLIEHLGGTDMAYGIDNLTNGKGTYAETIINGGTIKSPYRAVRQFLNGVEAKNILTVNGGTIEGANKSIFFHDPSKNANTGSLTVGADATLKGDVYLFVTAGSTEWPVDVKIAKAALEGKIVSGNVPEGYAVSEYPTYWTVEALNLDELTIEDACVSYVNVAEKTVGELTYVRQFNDTKWQTIYLPFAVPAANLMNDFEVAYIYNAGYKNNSATIDFVEINDVNYMLQANYPYLIRAKEAGTYNIVVENATLMPTAVNKIDCSSVFETFEFIGSYTKVEGEPCADTTAEAHASKGHFVMNEGKWTKFDVINPFRVYLTITLRNGSEFAYPTEESIIMRKVDKNGNVDTSVEKIGVDADILGIYDLQGRRVLEPQKGEIYIINGKKVVY